MCCSIVKCCVHMLSVTVPAGNMEISHKGAKKLSVFLGILVLDILCWISILSRFCFGRTVLGVLCWACLYMLHSVGQ